MGKTFDETLSSLGAKLGVALRIEQCPAPVPPFDYEPVATQPDDQIMYRIHDGKDDAMAHSHEELYAALIVEALNSLSEHRPHYGHGVGERG